MSSESQKKVNPFFGGFWGSFASFGGYFELFLAVFGEKPLFNDRARGPKWGVLIKGGP